MIEKNPIYIEGYYWHWTSFQKAKPRATVCVCSVNTRVPIPESLFHRMHLYDRIRLTILNGSY